MADYLSRIRDIQSRAADARSKMAEVQEQLSGRQQEEGREKREDYLENVRDHIENFQARMNDVMGIGQGVAGLAKNLKKYRQLVQKRRAALGARRGQTESDTAASDASRPAPVDRPPGESSGARAAAEPPGATGTADDSPGIAETNLDEAARSRPVTFEDSPDLGPYAGLRGNLTGDLPPSTSQAEAINLADDNFDSIPEPGTAESVLNQIDQAAATQRGGNLGRGVPGDTDTGQQIGNAFRDARPEIQGAQSTGQDTPGAQPIRDTPAEEATPGPETNALRPAEELEDGGGVDNGLASLGRTGARTAAETGLETGEMTGLDMALGSVPVLGEFTAAIGGIIDAISGAVQAGKEAAREKQIEDAPVQQQSGVAATGADPDALAE